MAFEPRRLNLWLVGGHGVADVLGVKESTEGRLG
jgi:hypothetical protein